MKTKLLALSAVLSMLAGGVFLGVQHPAQAEVGGMQERRVNANLLLVKVDDRWVEVPMVPLADHLCASGNDLYDAYCE